MAGVDSREALLKAAKQLVAERGYAGTSVRELTALSGTNLAAVNYHFGSRERLLNQALLESFLDWTERLGRVAQADQASGPTERMTTLAKALLGDFPETQPLFAAFLEALLQARRSPELSAQLAEHYAEQRRRVAQLVIGERVGPEVPERAVQVMASVLIAVVDGLLLQSLVDQAAVPSGEELALISGGCA